MNEKKERGTGSIKNKKDFRFFDVEKCDDCGICFSTCPVMELPEEYAKKDIMALIQGDVESSQAYDRCNTCHTCDVVCPQNADPYELILERWGEKRMETGIPHIAATVFPNEPGNYWGSIKTLMPKEELEMIDRWADLHPRKEVVLTGFYSNIFPYLTQTKLLDDLRPAIAGSPEAFFGCAGDIYKTGAFDVVEQMGKRMQKIFSEMGVEKMYCLMSAESMMPREVLPKRFGINFDFEIHSIEEWLLERIRSGKIEIKKKLDMKVTVQDGCLSKLKRGIEQDINREILQRIGCEIVEMEHNHEKALCCGYGASASKLWPGMDLFAVLYLMESSLRRLKEAEATGADALVVYCHGCLFMLSMMNEFLNIKIPIYHVTELVQMAIGEEPVHKHAYRAWDVIAGVTNLLLKCVLSPSYRAPFQPKPVLEEVEPLAKPSEDDIRMIEAFAKLYHSPIVQNSVTKALIGAASRAIVAVYSSVWGRSYYERKLKRD